MIMKIKTHNNLPKLLKENLHYVLKRHTFDVDRTEPDEYLIWIQMADIMTNIAKEFVQEECESYWYELAYHPDDDSIYVMVVGDANAEHLKIWKRTEELIRIMAKGDS